MDDGDTYKKKRKISMLVISILVMSLYLFTKEYSTNKMRCQQ